MSKVLIIHVIIKNLRVGTGINNKFTEFQSVFIWNKSKLAEIPWIYYLVMLYFRAGLIVDKVCRKDIDRRENIETRSLHFIHVPRLMWKNPLTLYDMKDISNYSLSFLFNLCSHDEQILLFAPQCALCKKRRSWSDSRQTSK